MIDVQNLTKQFDGTTVLDGVSATFRDGEVNMIIGQSGSGKTVLMKSMIGLHKPESGCILFGEGANARNICAMGESELRLLHREVGMLFQGSALFDSQTVEENVMFPLEMFSDMNHDEIVARARFCLERVNIPERAYRLMPGEISGGMQKRVAIARAIALNPKYLFCDEPNSGLDPRTSLVIDRLICDVTREFGICTIINSHDMNSIMEIGDNILFLRNGKKEWQGSRHEIFHAENEALNDFVFASDLFKKVREAELRMEN